MSDDDFELNYTQANYINQFLSLRNSKVDAQNFSKLIWKQYYDQAIDLSNAVSLACKINSNQLANEA